MKNNWAIYFIALLLTLVSCGQGDHAEHTDTYTCPMHPTVIADRPGTCPVCEMDLVRKARAGEEVAITEDLAKLLKSPNEAVVASVKTIKGVYKSVPGTVDVQGVVTYDTRNIYTIPSRVAGRLERSFLKYAFQPVSKGQKVAAVYSPELITAQRELLFLLTNDVENKALIDAAKNKLELLGMTSAQVDELIREKTTSATFSIYSPYSGYLVVDEPAPTAPSSPGTSSMPDGMGEAAASSSTSQPTPPATSLGGSIIREGSYVTAGQVLFKIVSHSALRIELDLPVKQSGAISQGDNLALNFGSGVTQNATVDFVQPFFSAGEDFLKLRVYIRQREGLRIGQLVSARIQAAASESLWVPRQAVLDLGTDKIVFVKDRGVLKPKTVTTGIVSEGLIEIKSGLASADEIAANAQYLVDSESFIKTSR